MVYQKIRLGPTRDRKSMISICSFNFMYMVLQDLVEEVRHACDFSKKELKKGQNKAKYLKIWAKMYKI